jgi:rubrerythrin
VIAELHRTLEQELTALLRGVSYECLVCGEFVMHGRESIFCPECGFRLQTGEVAAASLEAASLEADSAG